MSVDYDLVILGGGSAARSAALRASQLKARVALIEPDRPPDAAPLFYQSWRQAIALQHQPLFDCAPRPDRLCLTELRSRAAVMAEALEENLSLPALAAAGVDVVVGEAEFYRRPTLGVQASGRSLRARKYLIAVGSQAAVPPIEGLHSTQFLTLDTIAQSPALADAAQVAVIGAEPRGLALAQMLGRSGAAVTLIGRGDRLLPAEDAEVARLLQAQLEADGVQVLTQTAVTLVKQLDHKTWVQAGDRAIEADRVILAVGQQPLLKSLNLDAAGVQWHPDRIPTNARLQTTNPDVYVCGDALGGAAFPHLAQHEAAIAIRNALLFSPVSVDYSRVPWAVFTLPELARVGLTEVQARQQYGDRVRVLRRYYKTLPIAQLQGEASGFCKLILLPNGRILGAHLLGVAASETIGAIALAIQQNLSLKAFADCPPIFPTGAELLHQAALDWQQQRSPFVQECLENWFNLRRLGL